MQCHKDYTINVMPYLFSFSESDRTFLFKNDTTRLAAHVNHADSSQAANVTGSRCIKFDTKCTKLQ